MFRKYYAKKEVTKRRDALFQSCDFGTKLREIAIVKHRQFWAKTPYTSEGDSHESGFIHGYASREKEINSLKLEVDYFRTLSQDIEPNNAIHFIKE